MNTDSMVRSSQKARARQIEKEAARQRELDRQQHNFTKAHYKDRSGSKAHSTQEQRKAKRKMKRAGQRASRRSRGS